MNRIKIDEIDIIELMNKYEEELKEDSSLVCLMFEEGFIFNQFSFVSSLFSDFNSNRFRVSVYEDPENEKLFIWHFYGVSQGIIKSELVIHKLELVLRWDSKKDRLGTLSIIDDEYVKDEELQEMFLGMHLTMMKIINSIIYEIKNNSTIIFAESSENTDSKPKSAPRSKTIKGSKDKEYNLKSLIYYGAKKYHKNGGHMSCECWGVRGHYRHYKNGKIVKIQPFKKGSKRDSMEPTDKTYILGGN